MRPAVRTADRPGARSAAAARRARGLAGALGLAALAALAGCAVGTGVQPWQKGDLARPEMGFDANGLEARNAAQVYTSKEASSGGTGVGGGGCGCN